MYQREQSWEDYLKRYGFNEHIGVGLERRAAPPYHLAPFAAMVAAPEEMDAIFQRSLAAVLYECDVRSVTYDSLRASFDWAMGSLLWRLDLRRSDLQELISDGRIQLNQLSFETRGRADQAYQDGRFDDALPYMQTCETLDPGDFSLQFNLGFLYLYHQSPARLPEARKAYLTAARLAGQNPAAQAYAGQALLWAAFTAYIQQDDAGAFDLAQKAVALIPHAAEARYFLARLAALNGDIDLALSSLEAAVRADRNYALRAVADASFNAMDQELKGWLDRQRAAARQQAENQGRTMKAQLGRSPVPQQEQAYAQRLQEEIAERWQQNSLFGFMDVTSKMVRFKIYMDGLHLEDRDEASMAAVEAMQALRAKLTTGRLPGKLIETLDGLLRQAERILNDAPSLAQAQAAQTYIDHAAKLWQIASSQAVLAGHKAEVNALAFSPVGQWLASAGSSDQSIRIWNTMTGECQHHLMGHFDAVNSLAFSPDGGLLASGGGIYKGMDFTIRLWSVQDGRSKTIIDRHINMVTKVLFNPAGTLVASASADGSVRLWRPTGEPWAWFDGQVGSITCMAFSPDGELLATGGEDQTIRLWEVKTSSLLGALLGHSGTIQSLWFTPDGKTLISSAMDHSIRFWNIPECQLKASADPGGRLTALALSPDGQNLAYGLGDDGLVRLWPYEALKPVTLLIGHSGGLTALAFSPDSTTLASGDAQGLVRLWDVAGQRGRAVRRGHQGPVTALTFNSDSSLLASGGRDASVRLWGLMLNEADAREIDDEEKERARREEQERQEQAAEAERQRQAWLADGCCEVCGTRLSVVERISRQVRCRQHR
ncbi:MAG TPA: hypothetical protein PKW33_20875 [Anaerolineaceae bacterium]|nr:hypothetical protein [Anaerolineaceae bacterium]HPN54063.1 hypothetical protein [Anaerolineaceae bacterium]